MGGCQRRRRLGDGAWNRWRRSRGTKSSVIKQISHLLCVMYSMATIVSDTVLQIWKSLSFQEKDTCTLMFTAALFTIAEVWKQPNCKWIKRCGIYWKKKRMLWCWWQMIPRLTLVLIFQGLQMSNHYDFGGRSYWFSWGLLPAPQNSDLPVKDDSMQYLKTIQKSVFFWWWGRITGWM